MVVESEDVGVMAKGAEPGIGPGRDGGGPPIPVDGHVAEIAEFPIASRQGSESRRIRGSRIR